MMQDFERIHQDFRPMVLRYLQRLSRELPADYRTVIILSGLEELKNRDVADILDIM